MAFQENTNRDLVGIILLLNLLSCLTHDSSHTQGRSVIAMSVPAPAAHDSMARSNDCDKDQSLPSSTTLASVGTGFFMPLTARTSKRPVWRRGHLEEPARGGSSDLPGPHSTCMSRSVYGFVGAGAPTMLGSGTPGERLDGHAEGFAHSSSSSSSSGDGHGSRTGSMAGARKAVPRSTRSYVQVHPETAVAPAGAAGQSLPFHLLQQTAQNDGGRVQPLGRGTGLGAPGLTQLTPGAGSSQTVASTGFFLPLVGRCPSRHRTRSSKGADEPLDQVGNDNLGVVCTPRCSTPAGSHHTRAEGPFLRSASSSSSIHSTQHSSSGSCSMVPIGASSFPGAAASKLGRPLDSITSAAAGLAPSSKALMPNIIHAAANPTCGVRVVQPGPAATFHVQPPPPPPRKPTSYCLPSGVSYPHNIQPATALPLSNPPAQLLGHPAAAPMPGCNIAAAGYGVTSSCSQPITLGLARTASAAAAGGGTLAAVGLGFNTLQPSLVAAAPLGGSSTPTMSIQVGACYQPPAPPAATAAAGVISAAPDGQAAVLGKPVAIYIAGSEPYGSYTAPASAGVGTEQQEQLMWHTEPLHQQGLLPSQWDMGEMAQQVQQSQLEQLLQEEQELQQQLEQLSCSTSQGPSVCPPQFSLFSTDGTQQLGQITAGASVGSLGHASSLDRSCNSSFTSSTTQSGPSLESVWQSISIGGITAGAGSQNSCLPSGIGRGASNSSSIWTVPSCGRTVSNSSSIWSGPSIARGVSGVGFTAAERVDSAAGLRLVPAEHAGARAMEYSSNRAGERSSGGGLYLSPDMWK